MAKCEWWLIVGELGPLQRRRALKSAPSFVLHSCGAFWLWSAPHTWLLAGRPPPPPPLHISAASFWSWNLYTGDWGPPSSASAKKGWMKEGSKNPPQKKVIPVYAVEKTDRGRDWLKKLKICLEKAEITKQKTTTRRNIFDYGTSSLLFMHGNTCHLNETVQVNASMTANVCWQHVKTDESVKKLHWATVGSKRFANKTICFNWPSVAPPTHPNMDFLLQVKMPLI